MNFSVRVTGVVVGVVLVATACGGGSSAKPVAQSPVSSSPVVSATPSPVVTPTVAPKSTPVVTPTPKPVVVTLGVVWAPGATGYGTVRPSELTSGGDPSGSISDITWTSWGGAQAEGTGTARYGAGRGACPAWKAAHPGSSETCDQRVPIVAYNLKASCGGHPGYSAVEWYFPLAGETRNLSTPSYSDLCSTDLISGGSTASVPSSVPPAVASKEPTCADLYSAAVCDGPQ